jgi:dTDP-4-dehydrorhamnose reductase
MDRVIVVKGSIVYLYDTKGFVCFMLKLKTKSVIFVNGV